MSRRRSTALFSLLIRLIFVLAVVGAAAFLVFWARLAPQDRYGLSVLALVSLVFGTAALILLAVYTRWQRAQAWRRAISAWNGGRGEAAVPTHPSLRAFTPAQLEQFTARLFEQMGYRVDHTGQSGDHGVDVRLVNLDGQVELVQCKQWSKPVGEPEVRDLAGAMLHENAARGYIVAPGGFSGAARRWARGKAIALVDGREINRLVQRAYR